MAINRIGSNFPVKPVSKLSRLIIDYDKSWLDFGITELKELASGMQKGDMIIHDGTRLVRSEPGPLGYFLFVRQPGNQLYWSLLQYLIKPAGIMLPTTGITDTEATLNAEVTDDEGLDCQGRFRYREIVRSSVSVQIGHTDNDTSVYGYTTEGTGGTYRKDWHSMGNNTNSDKRSAMLRFTGITIPAGVVISNAWITFVARTTVALTPCNLRLWADKAAAPTAPTTVATFWGKARSNARVDWANVEAWTAGVAYDSPDLKRIIQELTDAYGPYVAGSMQIIIWNDGSGLGCHRRPTDFQEAAGSAAVLNIEYYEPGIWVETPWRNGLRIHDPFHEDLVGLTPATDYEAQCLLQCVDGVGLWSAGAFFTTLP